MAETTLQKREPENSVESTESTRVVTLTPRIDIIETEDELLILADLPGVAPHNVDVRFENGELTLHGRRDLPTREGRRALWCEYHQANYNRAFRLSEKIAADRIHAELKHGVLTVHLPKAEAAKPRRIAIKGD